MAHTKFNNMDAIDWLVQQVNSDCYTSTFIRKELIDKAKEMQRQLHSRKEISDEDIEKSISYDSKDPYVEGYINGAKWMREQYTLNIKEHPNDEISDEEIEEIANQKYGDSKKLLRSVSFSFDCLENHFIDGMKKYRELLKSIQ